MVTGDAQVIEHTSGPEGHIAGFSLFRAATAQEGIARGYRVGYSGQLTQPVAGAGFGGFRAPQSGLVTARLSEA